MPGFDAALVISTAYSSEKKTLCMKVVFQQYNTWMTSNDLPAFPRSKALYTCMYGMLTP